MALRALSDYDNIRFDRGARDLRNYEVRSRIDGERIGRVDDMLIDEAGRTRYLSIDLEDRHRHVLLPSGQGRIEAQGNTLWVAGLTRATTDLLPVYEGEPEGIDVAYERRLDRAYDRGVSDPYFYERPEYTAPWSEPTDTSLSKTAGRLVRVEHLDDVDIARGEPDPRGWPVYGRDGERLGQVDHLLGDTSAMKVRYLVMTLDDLLSPERRQVLVPVGHVDLDSRKKLVQVDALDRASITAVPAYRPGQPLDRTTERAVLDAYAHGYGESHRHRHPRFRDRYLFGLGPRNGDVTDETGETDERAQRSSGRTEEERPHHSGSNWR